MKSLTPKQSRFVDEYLVDLNGKQAAIRSGYSARTAEVQASKLLRNPKVQRAISARMESREQRTEITQDMVLRRYWDIATADQNELTQYRRTCCRHCWGVDHGFQWVDEAEYQKALDSQKEDDDGAMPPPPELSGGFGFDSAKDPAADCPRCHGEGVGQPFVADTRKLQGPARMLYAGIKQTKEGIEVKTHDQLAALNQVARHLGLFNDKLQLDVTDALADRLKAARERVKR
ncbi:terminase small subunit [Niveibacterium terrae]|uniref:terminase small subunit n=1 Tax=Niveibacterium terrae TaxID=3373598 RepID=UPI003A93BF66